MTLAVEGNRVATLVDSGSTVTVIKRSAAREICDLNRKLKPCQAFLRTLNEKPVPVEGQIDLRFNIKGKIITHQALVCDTSSLSAPLLLGTDFLRKHGGIINFKDNTVCLAGRLLKMNNETQRQSVGMCITDPVNECAAIARVSAKCNIPARSRKIQYLHVGSALNGSEVIIDPEPQYLPVVGRTLATVNEGVVPVCFLNLGDCSLHVEKGIPLAKVHYLHEEETIPADASPLVGYCSTTNSHTAKEHSKSDRRRKKIEDLDLTHLDSDQQEQIRDLLHNYREIINAGEDDIGRVKGVHHQIKLADKHPKFTPQWRLPHSSKATIEEKVKEMLATGVISPSTSPWCSPVILVKKPSGEARFAIDYRQLNQITEKDNFPVPNITETLESVSGKKFYTIIDAKSAYHQIEMEHKSKPMTAFHTPSGAYHFNRMPFGLSNAPATWNRTISQILRRQIGKSAYIYLDDACVYGETFTEHLANVEEILYELKEAGVQIGLEKCNFARSSVKYLGHVISNEGTRPDPGNLEAVKSFPRPTTPKRVRSFLGLCNYYRRFVANFATIAAPLTELTRKANKFKWLDDHQGAFEALKTAMMEAPVLRSPDFTKQFILHCDASTKAYGSVLSQEIEGQDHPIAFHSKKFSGAELNYSTTEKEALAIVASITHFDAYVKGYHFTVVTDHAALRQIFSVKNSRNGRLARWALLLSEYDYKVMYKKGTQNVVADALSRNPCEAAEDTGEINTVFVTTVIGSEQLVTEASQRFEKESLREAQLQDDVWGPVLRFLEGDTSATVSPFATKTEFYAEDGILYRHSQRKKPAGSFQTIVVPKSLVSAALVLSHDSRIGAHQGVVRTWKRAVESWFWINMTNDIRQHIRTCIECQKRKNGDRIVPPMGDFPPISRPLDRVGMDLVELPQSDSGHRYVLTIVDHLTRYLATYPLRSKHSEEVIRAVLKYVSTYGVIRSVVSDQGSEFISTLFRTICQHLEIKFNTTTAYNPAGNGQTERYNRTLKGVLSHLASHDRSSWNDSLMWATFAINTSYQDSIEDVPFFLFHGRDADVPIVKLLNRPRIDYSLGEDYAAEVSQRLHVAFKTVKEKSEAAHLKSKENRVKRIKNEGILPGSVVMLRNEAKVPENPRAWPTPYEGPYRVIEKTATNARIRGIFNRKEKYVHLHRLKVAYLRGCPFPLEEHPGDKPADTEATRRGDTRSRDDGDGPTDSQESGPQKTRYNLRRR